METISFDEMSTLDVPSAALRSSLDKIASALQKVGAAGTDASAAVDELRTSLRAAAAQSVKSARSLAKFDEINRLSAPAAEKADAEKTTAAAKKTGSSTRKSGSRSGSRAKAEADGEVSIWQGGTANLAGCLGWILVVSANLLRPGHCGVAGRVGADQADSAGCVGAGARGSAGPLEWRTAALGRLPADGVSARRGQQLFPGVRADPGWDHQRGHDNFGQPVCLALRADRGAGQHRGAARAGPAAGDLAGGDGRASRPRGRPTGSQSWTGWCRRFRA